MTDETQKPKLELVPPTEEELDEEEKEFCAVRRDLPGVKGASAAGIVAISVGKAPTKNEFFRCHLEFRPIIPMNRPGCEKGSNRENLLLSTKPFEYGRAAPKFMFLSPYRQ